MTEPTPFSPAGGGRWNSLDGLRTVGVLLVFGIHSGYPALFGGRFGVDVFFPLSGFLITTLIVNEVQRSGRFQLRRFYWRRILRLYPALLVVVLSTFFIRSAIVYNGDLRSWESTAFYALTYTMNLAVSFTSRDVTIALTPTWTLALEEQFYLLWPLLLLLLMRGLSLRRCGFVALVLALASWTSLGLDRSLQASFRPDTRAGALMIGCAAALLAYGKVLSRQAARKVLPAATVVLAAGVFVGGTSWRHADVGGVVLVSSASAVLIVALLGAPGALLDRLLAAKPLVWLGRRSYGFYLVHLPILAELRRHTHSRAAATLLGFSLAVAVSDLLFRFVEQPVLRYRDRTTGSVASVPAG